MEQKIAENDKREYGKIILLRQGSANITTEFSHISLNAQDALIVSPHLACEISKQDEAVVMEIVGPGAFLRQEMENLFIDNNPCVSIITGRMPGCICKMTDINEADFHKLEAYLELLSDDTDSLVGTLYRQAVFLPVFNLISKKYRHYSIHPGENKKNPIIMQLLDYISNNYKDAGLVQAAQRIGCDPAYLSRLVKSQTGRPFCHILLEVKMRVARQMLVKADYDEARISEAVGFTSLRYFRLVFQKEFGLTPKQYRTRLLKKGGADI